MPESKRIAGAVMKAPGIHPEDLVQPYIEDLQNVVDLEAIRDSGVTIESIPWAGPHSRYWEAIADRYRLNLTIVNRKIDPTFGFMTLDHDGQIRMDCSSPYAMASLVALREQYQVALGNDPDADRHGIVTPSAGLMNPNHFLAVAIEYLVANRPLWSPSVTVGKTVVSGTMIDRVVTDPDGAFRRCPSDSSGSRQACSTAACASAAKKAPGRASCGGTALSGRPTRTV